MYELYIQCIVEWDFPFCNFAKSIVYIKYMYIFFIDILLVYNHGYLFLCTSLL